ncbi:hypothetical protein A6R68_22359 [Neotoma lepida]|uniref:Uncharacterized protein n=1 Tax=Neotoma lepida TaxID=56216 RepID=A0A1A6HZJ9_NEOLE|nr:hypothetical protein A6R68_22359 [Neotoma lepida]
MEALGCSDFSLLSHTIRTVGGEVNALNDRTGTAVRFSVMYFLCGIQKPMASQQQLMDQWRRQQWQRLEDQNLRDTGPYEKVSLCHLLLWVKGRSNPARPGGFPGANSPGPVADLYGPASQDSGRPEDLRPERT